ncbi:MFS transporter [Sphingobium sp. SCG-1]|uniref:MFS transporter n=1 Tax=Sphingobium sp. SCG-1 TaxID=2072936 RepID=UPI001671744C|nr:MFS transporter [Sphingobium sp. SCG-1]
MTKPLAPAGRLSRTICVGWGLGTLAPAMVLMACNVLLLRYLTDQVGVAAALASTLIAVSKLVDAILDPLMGYASDRTKNKRGRRRPYLILGGVLLAMSVVGLFTIPSFTDADLRAVYVGGVLLFYAIAYTVFNIPYLAMPAEMTTDYHERSYLMSFRVYALGLGAIAGAVIGPMLLAALGGGSKAYLAMALVFVPLILASAWASFYYTRNAPFAPSEPGSRLPIAEQIHSILSNRPFVVLIAAKFLTLLLMGIQSVFAFYFTYVLKLSDAYLGQYFLAFSLGTIVSQPLWLKVARWTGSKRNTFIAALLLGIPAYLSWLAATPGESSVFILLRALVIGASGGGAVLMGQSLLPDTMEYDYRRTGQRREGIYAGFFTTAEKLSGALGIALVGAILGAAGYVQSQGRPVAQPQSAIEAIYAIMALLPVLINILTILCLSFYSLSEERLKTTGRLVSNHEA